MAHERSSEMKQQGEAKPELSPRVRALIEASFSPGEQASIPELLREFHWSLQPLIDERVHLDILEICGGRIEKVRELVALARVDWRDLIVTAEYDVKDGKIVQNERGRIRLAEVSQAKMKRMRNK